MLVLLLTYMRLGFLCLVVFILSVFFLLFFFLVFFFLVYFVLFRCLFCFPLLVLRDVKRATDGRSH